jgi:hypothetical protein
MCLLTTQDEKAEKVIQRILFSTFKSLFFFIFIKFKADLRKKKIK